MDLSSLPLAHSGDGVELLRAAAVLNKLKHPTAAAEGSSTHRSPDLLPATTTAKFLHNNVALQSNSRRGSTSMTNAIPGAIWSRIASYSRHPREIRQVLTAVSPSVRLALTPIAVSHTRSASVDTHDSPAGARPYTPSSLTTAPSTPRSPPPGMHLPPAGLSCDALRVHRWWLWNLHSFPLNLDVPLGTITATVADAHLHGGNFHSARTPGGLPPMNLDDVGASAWTPASISSTTPAQYMTTSPLMLLGSGRSSAQMPLNRAAPNTAGTITEDVWQQQKTAGGAQRTTGPDVRPSGLATDGGNVAVAAAAAPTAAPAEDFDMFPSAPLDPVSLAFPFYEEHWDTCQVCAVHIRFIQDDMSSRGPGGVGAGLGGTTPSRGLGFATVPTQNIVLQRLSVKRELEIGHRVAGCLARVPHLENFALTLVPRRHLGNGPQPTMVHGYYNPLGNPGRSATTPGSLLPANNTSPMVRPQASPLLSPALSATQAVPPLAIVPSSASVTSWMHVPSLLLAPVAIVPLAQRFAPHLTTLSVSNARIVATTEAVGDDVFPIGATEADMEAFRVIKAIQEEHAQKLRDAAEAAAAVAAAAAAEAEAAAAAEREKEPAVAAVSLPPAAAIATKSQQTPVQHHQQHPPFRAPQNYPKNRSDEQLATFPGGTGDSPTTPTAPVLPPRRLGGEGLPHATVQRLRLVDCVIDAAALRRLSELEDLEHLVFIGCTFPTTSGIDGLDALASTCPKLQHLVLCSCDVRSVAPLAVLSQLLTIDLSSNPHLDDITPLSHLLSLEELNINGCSVRSVAPLAACPNMWKLEVAGNPLGGASPSAAPQGGRSMSSIASLGGVSAAARSSTTTTHGASAKLSSCGGLEQVTKLQYLDAENCGLVNIFPLLTLSSLRHLSLARNRIRHDEYARLPPEFSVAFPCLEHLDLSRTTLAFLRHMDGLRRLRVLRIDDTLLAHHAFPQHLTELPELRVLYADNSGLDDIRRLPDVCPKLERLYASKNKQLTDDRMPVFSAMPHLRCVHLRACSLTATTCFQKCAQIRELDISDNTLTRSGAAELSDTAASLEVLLIANCGIKDTTFLKDLVQLQRVELRGNVLNAALPLYFMMLDSHAHMHAQQQAAAFSPPHRGGGGASNTPGSLSNRSFQQRVYSGMTPMSTGGGASSNHGAGDDDQGGAAYSRSSGALLRSPHLGPSAASPSRLQMKQAHVDPLAWA